jgi:acyl-CoA synthetase (AMP-forming)/AMP-acid ligase II
MQATPDDVFLGAVPFSNTFGLSATILSCAVAGARLVCMPHFNPVVAQAVIALEQVTIHNGVPTMFAMELNQPDFDRRAYSSLRTGIMAGAPCPAELVVRVRDEMDCHVLIGYGLTEASPAVAVTHLDDGPVTATQTVGVPLDGVEIKVVDQTGTALAPGSEGELCVRGYNVMLGYWDDPQATSEVLDADGWLHTGDLGVIDPDGPVRIVGRLQEMIIRSGLKVHPGTVEMVLRTHPAVKECAVVGVPDLIYGSRSSPALCCEVVCPRPMTCGLAPKSIPTTRARIALALRRAAAPQGARA